MMKWCNNLHCAGNKSEIFQLKKDAIEFFGAYMQEVNFKKIYNFRFIFLTFLFRTPHLHRKFQLQDLWSVPCRGSVRNIISLHTHHHTSTLHCQLFSSHHSLFTRDTVMNRERPTFVEFCSSISTCVISSMFFTKGNPEFLRGISLLRQGKSNYNRDISAVV